MPKFVKMNPSDVVVGRGRLALLEREPYVEAVKAAQAGRIDLEPGEKPARVRRLFRLAAKQAGIRARSSWEDNSQRALLWKRSATKPVAAPKPAARRRGRPKRK